MNQRMSIILLFEQSLCAGREWLTVYVVAYLFNEDEKHQHVNGLVFIFNILQINIWKQYSWEGKKVYII